MGRCSVLTSTTISGVITGKTTQELTLLLKTGKIEQVKYAITNLEIGDCVKIAYNGESGKIIGIHKIDCAALSCCLPTERQQQPFTEDED